MPFQSNNSNAEIPRLKVILTVDSLTWEHGGPSRSVPSLAKALANSRADVELWTLKAGSVPVDGVMVRGFTSSYELSRNLKALDPKSTLVHDNGLWLPFNVLVCSAARTSKIPYVISARGMLDSLSLNQSFWKKKAAWIIYQHRLLANASIIHATSDMEALGIRKLGFGKKVVVIPNGVDIPPMLGPQPKTGNSVLYLSRLHPQKGIEVLLNAWAELRPSDWRLKLAGSGESKYVVSLNQLATKLGIAHQVDWLGPLDDEKKWPAYRKSDFFVLPSFSESFGIVIAEALASGLPVITTTGTPWLDLQELGCGIAVEPTPKAISAALGGFMNMSVAQRMHMGSKGRSLIIERCSWERIAKDMLNAYAACS